MVLIIMLIFFRHDTIICFGYDPLKSTFTLQIYDDVSKATISTDGLVCHYGREQWHAPIVLLWGGGRVTESR